MKINKGKKKNIINNTKKLIKKKIMNMQVKIYYVNVVEVLVGTPFSHHPNHRHRYPSTSFQWFYGSPLGTPTTPQSFWPISVIVRAIHLHKYAYNTDYNTGHPVPRSPEHPRVVFYYEQQIKWEVKRIHISGCRCNERLKAKTDGSTRLTYTGLPTSSCSPPALTRLPATSTSRSPLLASSEVTRHNGPDTSGSREPLRSFLRYWGESGNRSG